MDCRLRKTLFFALFFLSNSLFATNLFTNLKPYLKAPSDLYLGVSGGYGKLKSAYDNTGVNNIIRIGFGSLWSLKKSLLLGGEIGFQTGTQMRLNTESTAVLGTNRVPTFLNEKTPVDFLLVGKWAMYDPFFIQAKGGYAYLSSVVTGADVKSNNTWLPEAQLGIGMMLSEHSRVLLGYQRFFGKNLKIITLDQTNGTYLLAQNATWQAALLTLEIKV